MDARATPYLRALWLGVGQFMAGIVWDLVWHAGHDEFEGTSQQVEVHWLLWIGFLAVLAATVLAFARVAAEERHPGFTVVLAASAMAPAMIAASPSPSRTCATEGSTSLACATKCQTVTGR